MFANKKLNLRFKSHSNKNPLKSHSFTTALQCSKLVLDKLEKFPEVVEVYYTTGSYALILKVTTTDIQSFQTFLMDKLQHVAEIQSTESFICLSQPIKRNSKLL